MAFQISGVRPESTQRGQQYPIVLLGSWVSIQNALFYLKLVNLPNKLEYKANSWQTFPNFLGKLSQPSLMFVSKARNLLTWVGHGFTFKN
jgi:hypothetical protein